MTCVGAIVVSAFRFSDMDAQPSPPPISTYETRSQSFGWLARAKRRERQPSFGIEMVALSRPQHAIGTMAAPKHHN